MDTYGYSTGQSWVSVSAQLDDTQRATKTFHDHDSWVVTRHILGVLGTFLISCLWHISYSPCWHK